jgi:hypothetical protein
MRRTDKKSHPKREPLTTSIGWIQESPNETECRKKKVYPKTAADSQMQHLRGMEGCLKVAHNNKLQKKKRRARGMDGTKCEKSCT